MQKLQSKQIAQIKSFEDRIASVNVTNAIPVRENNYGEFYG